MNANFDKVLAEVRQQHPEETPEQQEWRAWYRIERHVDRRPPKTVPRERRGLLPSWWVIAWGIVVLLLLGAIAAKAEPDERLRLIHRAMTAESAEPQQPGGLILQLRNQGTVLTTRPAGLLILNCSTNMSCSMTGSTFNITSSSTASTAFSALTASLNTNVGTFSASGNSWDFTAATIFKLRAGAALTTSAAGDLGYDTTAGRWHGFIGAADRLFIGSTNVGVAGQAALSNADGTFTFADPIVSGPAAEGAAPVNNPVWVSGTGTDGFIRALRLFDLDSGAGAQWAQGVNLRKIASGGSVEAGTASDPLRVDPTGTTTQPVSGTVTANAGTGTFTVGQATGTNLHMVCDSGCTPGGSFADSTAFTFGTTAVNNMGAVVDDTATNTVAENSAAAPRMSASRVLYANPRDASGNEIASATAAPAGTERGLITRPIPSGTQTVAGTVTANIGTTGGLALDATVSATQPRTVTGNVASGAADSGNPVKTGGVFNTTQPTVTTGQRVDTQHSARGEVLIAKGVSGFSIDNTGFNVTGSLPAGTNNIGGVNVAQINGVTPLMGNGLTGTGSPRVTIASDNSNAAGIGGSATGSAVPSAARFIGGQSGANLVGFERCDSSAFLNMSTATTTEIVALTASQSIRVCSYRLIAGGTANVKFVRGTGTNCATGQADVSANFPFIANTGMAANGGASPIYVVTSANALCVTSSAAVTVAVEVTYTKF